MISMYIELPTKNATQNLFYLKSRWQHQYQYELMHRTAFDVIVEYGIILVFHTIHIFQTSKLNRFQNGILARSSIYFGNNNKFLLWSKISSTVGDENVYHESNFWYNNSFFWYLILVWFNLLFEDWLCIKWEHSKYWVYPYVVWAPIFRSIKDYLIIIS